MHFRSTRGCSWVPCAGARSSIHLRIGLPRDSAELMRVLIPGGYLLLAFQAEGEPKHSCGTHKAHTCRSPVTDTVWKKFAVCLEDLGFEIYATALRAAELEDESTCQGFVIASSPLS